MPTPQPPGTFGVSSFSIYTHSQMISSNSMTFNDKLFPNLYLQPGPPLEHLRPGQMLFANLCLYKQFESPVICLSAPFWWPNFTQSWKRKTLPDNGLDPREMTPSMVCWHFQLSQAPEGTLKSWRKSIQSLGPLRHRAGPVACFSWMKRTLPPASTSVSNFKLVRSLPFPHITIHHPTTGTLLHIHFSMIYSHIYVHIVCLSQSYLQEVTLPNAMMKPSWCPVPRPPLSQ